MGAMTLLVPVRFPQDEPLADANVQGLAGFDVVLFGYWEIPGGADPDVVREEHATEAEAELYELAAQFSRAGAQTDVQLHFGPGGEELTALQDRIAEATDADAVVVPGQFTLWNNVLVPLRDDRNADRIVEFLDAFDPDTMFTLELLHVTSDPDSVEAGRAMLDGVAEMLFDRGFTESDLEVTVELADPATAIVDASHRHNVVVIGESEEPSDPARFLGPVYQDIVDGADVPVVVVRSR